MTMKPSLAVGTLLLVLEAQMQHVATERAVEAGVQAQYQQWPYPRRPIDANPNAIPRNGRSVDLPTINQYVYGGGRDWSQRCPLLFLSLLSEDLLFPGISLFASSSQVPDHHFCSFSSSKMYSCRLWHRRRCLRPRRASLRSSSTRRDRGARHLAELLGGSAKPSHMYLRA